MNEEPLKTLALEIVEELIAANPRSSARAWELYKFVAADQYGGLFTESLKGKKEELKTAAEYCFLAAECFDSVCKRYEDKAKLAKEKEAEDE
ncbi:MAG: hypothetical protein F6K39_27270 [Okeania sp. SIO3B3]|nr:hypothetical protein [Okeania sp. SIO3B3]